MFSGNTLECLKDYLSKLKWGQTDCSKERKNLIKFVSLTPKTIRRWHTGETIPKGLPLIITRYFLESVGYNVAELNALQDYRIYNLGKLIAHKIVSYSQVSEQLRYRDPGDLLVVLRGKAGLSYEKIVLVEKICAEHQEWLDSHGGKTKPQKKEKTEITQSSVTSYPAHNLVDETKNQLYSLLKIFKEIPNILIPLLDRILSDEFSPEQRQSIREEMPGVIFDRSNDAEKLYQRLYALCSETARNTAKAKNKEAIANDQKR
ncbi:MAG: hypothetical protein M1338_05660 [Patescibacteria group bacterium]|nr:hypothetical protein [Patescibacteria group bacterium]